MADNNTNQRANTPRQPGLNMVTISGNLTHDPELKEPKGGPIKVCTLRVAVNGPIPRTEGRRQRVDFFRVDVWGTMNSNARPEAQAKHLTKGREVTVTGRIQIDQPRDENGRITDTYVTIVADQVRWHGGPRQDGTPDTVVTESGTPDTVAVETPAAAPETPVAAPAVEDPPPY